LPTNNFANWHILKLKSTGNHRRKQIENKVSSLEDYAVEVIQETEKDFNNASLTRFDQPKKNKQKNQSQQWKIDRLAKIKLSNNKASKYHPIREARNAITRKP
jgi:6-pyruvoyl-tetrahydropterin synthase